VVAIFKRAAASSWGRALRATYYALKTRVSRTVEAFLSGRIAVWLVFGAFSAVIAARYLHAFVTGYILPDEAWYFITFILEGSRPFYREAFQAVFLLFFYGVRDVFSFLWRGLFYSIFWTLGSLLLTYKILKISGASQSTASLVLLTVPLFTIFPSMAPFIVTESVGLFFAMLGIYLLLLHFKNGKAKYAFLSALAFVLAYKCREPYLIFAVGNLATLLILRRNLRSTISYAVPVSIVAPIPVRFGSDLNFAQPIYTILTRLMPPLITAIQSGLAQGVSIPSLTYDMIFSATFDVPLRAGLVEVVQAVGASLLIARNPLFVILTIISVVFLGHSAWTSKSSVNRVLFYNTAFALVGFVVPIIIIVGTLPGALTVWTSTIIRASHTAFPMLVSFKDLYSKRKVKRIAPILVMLMVIFSLAQLTQYSIALQTSLSPEPVNRLSLDYKAPYYRLYLLAQNSRHTLVLGLHLRAIRVYMSMLPNVVVLSVPSTEEGFKDYLSRGWDKIFLYDDFFTINSPSMLNVYPEYYRQILTSRNYPGYTVETLWVDGESYAIKMTKILSAYIQEPASLPSCNLVHAHDGSERTARNWEVVVDNAFRLLRTVRAAAVS